jgi:uncharacterized protein YdhG (YjbR/CyaY superfamily)
MIDQYLQGAPMKTDPDLAAYLESFPPTTRAVLDKIRATVRKVVPDAEETRSYGVGAFKRGGTYVIYYGGYPKHVAVYPVYRGEASLNEELKPYTSGKATAKFMLDKPIPYGLITKIVKAKVKEAAARVEAKAIKIAKPKKAAKKAVKKAVKKVAKKTFKKATKK